MVGTFAGLRLAGGLAAGLVDSPTGGAHNLVEDFDCGVERIVVLRESNGDRLMVSGRLNTVYVSEYRSYPRPPTDQPRRSTD